MTLRVCWWGTSRESSTDEWILDSGCSYHMCPNKDLFHTLTKVYGGMILIGNGHICRTEGIGTTKLKIHDGVIKTLMEVRYIPDLKKNLISLGSLDSNRCKIVLEGGMLKVTSDALVLMKDKREGNLYFLQGSMVIGSASVSSEASGANISSNSTKLWHMRLGHAEEKAIVVFYKQGLLKSANSCKIEFCKHRVLEKQTQVKFITIIHCTKGVAWLYTHIYLGSF